MVKLSKSELNDCGRGSTGNPRGRPVKKKRRIDDSDDDVVE